MIFLVSAKLFELKRVRAIDLLSLLRVAARRGHTLFMTNDEEIPEIADRPTALDAWVALLAEPIRTEAMLLVEQLRIVSSNTSARGSFVVVVSDGEGETDLQDRHMRTSLEGAVRLASLPLFILIENGLSDAAFLRRVLPPAWRARFAEWEQAGFIQFENGGGIDEMVRIVEHYSTGKAPDPVGLGKIAWRASHVLISDRDSHFNGDESAKAKALRRSCTSSGMANRVHVLHRRDQESYLPREAADQLVAGKKGLADAERESMLSRLRLHFDDPRGRLHDRLPTKGRAESWFKNAFLTAAIDWDDHWFIADGSAEEMTEIAELVASFV